jgi:hypothetical protein
MLSITSHLQGLIPNAWLCCPIFPFNENKCPGYPHITTNHTLCSVVSRVLTGYFFFSLSGYYYYYYFYYYYNVIILLSSPSRNTENTWESQHKFIRWHVKKREQKQTKGRHILLLLAPVPFCNLCNRSCQNGNLGSCFSQITR